MASRFIEQFADSPQRVRVMFRVALITLLAVAGYNGMIGPQASYLFAAQQRSRWDTRLSEQQKQIYLSIDELKKKAGNLEAQYEQFQKILFQPDTVSEFFFGLEGLAEKADCKIESLTFDDTDSRPAEKESQDAIVQAMRASVVAIGNYDAFVRFFEQLGQYPQKISIGELLFEPLEQGRSMLRCNATITIYVTNKTAANKH
jgi:Tfp pilus assembly protein PilO